MDGDDQRPRLLSDGKSFLFASNNRTGGRSYELQLARLVRKDAPVEPIKGLEEEEPRASAEPSAADLLATGEWEWRLVERLPEPINSVKGVHGADMTADGLTIVFASIGRVGGYGAHDLWMASRKSLNDSWSSPANLGDVINTDRNELIPRLSRDGLTLMFEQDGQTVVSKRRTSTAAWSRPEPFVINAFGPPDVSDDGCSLALAWSDGGSPGIAIARRSSSVAPWPPPTSLGPPVNTDLREESVTLSNDGRLLIFDRRSADDWNTGDLWMSTREGWDEPWNEPVRLDALNSLGLDRNPRLLPDGRTLLYDRDNEFYLARVVRKDAPVEPIKGLEEDGQAAAEPFAADLLATGEWEWRVVERLPEPINSEHTENGGDISADGRVIVFSSRRVEGSFGSADLWCKGPPTFGMNGCTVNRGIALDDDGQ